MSYDQESFAREAAEINRREKQSQVRREYRRVWEKYGASFGSDESEIREELEAFVEKCCDLLYRCEFRAIAELGAAVGLDISQYEERFWESLIDRTDSDHLRALAPEVRHLPGVAGRLERRIQESEMERTITSVLALENGFLSEGDVQFLNERSEVDFVEWLVEGHRELPLMVRAGLEGQHQYSATIRDAIRRLSNESPLNRMRAEKLYEIAD